ncbi:energy transducer TonB [Leptospira langatensis]|uniref:Energy transducer TonB n=1 Tax=Leptospira langatensis TaxID=2484983 RepID=A0A5F1ZN51_9LEPT|nr:energy transducer TonB [Leptospira langatensis]TGK05131.1 energy transducer TonB [Leptospira langatensis]TGL38268.1 energy transducer TonB [Leptospira langatensis]
MKQQVAEETTSKSKLRKFIDRYRIEFWVTTSVVLQLLVFSLWYVPTFPSNRLEKLVDEVAFVDNLVIQDPNQGAPDDGDFEETDTLKKKEDPRIAGAQDQVISGATSPIDLSPNVIPQYTKDAQAAGITGTITIEVVIADTGEVLRVRNIGKSLGFGLENAAIEAFYKKKYSPSILEGKPITVKVLVPVRFQLN